MNLDRNRAIIMGVGWGVITYLLMCAMTSQYVASIVPGIVFGLLAALLLGRKSNTRSKMCPTCRGSGRIWEE